MAVTRARRHIAVVCDTQTVQNHAFLKSLIDHMTTFGEVRTAFEYIHDIVPQNYTRDHKETKANASSCSSTKQKVKEQPPSKTEKEHKNASVSSSNENTANDKHKTSGVTALKEEDKNRYTEISEQVELFLKDLGRSELQFPSSYNSHDRLLVHQMAEELGLVHESRGEGKNRCITISRPRNSTPDEKLMQKEDKEVVHIKASNSHREMPCQPPLDLKSLHLERMKREQDKREENFEQKKQQIKTPAASSKKTKTAKGL